MSKNTSGKNKGNGNESNEQYTIDMTKRLKQLRNQFVNVDRLKEFIETDEGKALFAKLESAFGSKAYKRR